MTHPDYVCTDEFAPAIAGPGWVLRGWWVAAGVAPPSIVLECENGVAEPIWHGHRRDDLAAAFPGMPEAGRGGFFGWLPPGSDNAAPARGRWWFAQLDGAWRVIAADLGARTPQGFRPADLAPAEPPASVLQAAARAADPETHVRIALAGRRALTLRLDIINKCNLRCVMCHYSEDDIFRRPARSVTPEQFETWFAPLAGHVHEVMLSCADEPLMSRHFGDIVRLLRRIAPHVAIRFCTNATLLTAPIARLLVEQQVDEVLFSFDACTRLTLEAIRRGADFERVLHNILRLSMVRDRAGSQLPVLGVNFVMMARNIHEAPAFVDLARELGIAQIDYRHLVEGYDRFRLHDEQLSRQPARFNHYRAAITDAAARSGLSVYLPPPLEADETWVPGTVEPTCSLDEFHATLARFVPETEGSPLELARHDPPEGRQWPTMAEFFQGVYCLRPFTEVFVRDQREVMPCPWHHQVLGTLDEGKDLLEAFLGGRFAQLRRAMFRPDGDPHCQGCPFKSMELPGDRVG